MRKLKILFVTDVGKLLNYPISKLCKDENGYYKVCNLEIKNTDNFENCFYNITEENKILEILYRDKVVELDPVVENLYKFSNTNKPKELKKLRDHIS